MKTTAQRFVGAPHNGSTLVRGVFDTKTKTFLDNPKTGKPMVFTKDSALMAAVRAANEADIEAEVEKIDAGLRRAAKDKVKQVRAKRGAAKQDNQPSA